jgi:methionyl-tRNA formyltransferase
MGGADTSRDPDGRVRAVFLGSGSFAVPIAEVVAKHPAVEVVAVVSAPDRPAGRGQRTRAVPVAELAFARGLPLQQPWRLRDPDAQAALLALDPQIILLADYGQIVPRALIDAPTHGALNVHPSLLPRHRGASPVAATILAGDRESGLTVIRMDAGIDSGPIVARERTAVADDETAPELEHRLAELGARVLGAVLEPWLAGRIEPVPQPSEGVTTTHPLRRGDGHLEWLRPAADLERQVRAYVPWPGSFASSSAGTLTVWRARVVPSPAGHLNAGAEPGTVLALDRGVAVMSGSDALELVEVQLAGRRRMSGRELRNGYPQLVGERLT